MLPGHRRGVTKIKCLPGKPILGNRVVLVRGRRDDSDVRAKTMRRGLLLLAALCLLPATALKPQTESRLTAPALPRAGQKGDGRLGPPVAHRHAAKGDPASPPSGVAGRRVQLRIGVNILLWWALNVVFNLCNKHCLNTWPHPWALATSYWLIGSLCMLPLYVPLPIGERMPGGKREWVAVRQVPRLRVSEIRAVAPVVGLLCVGHATSTLAPAYGTVAFSNIIKTAEPLFTCVFSYLFYRRVFSVATYFALLLVVSGVVLFST